MCDYCGCRRSGPTSELAAEHERLLELGEHLDAALDGDVDAVAAAGPIFDEFLRMLQMHAAKEEIGLFVHAKASTPLGDQIDQLCREHDDLHRWLGDGLAGPRVADALRLLITHIEDEEYDLFPHIFHALDPEQWEEIELAHRAIEAVWDDAPAHTHQHADPHEHSPSHEHADPHEHTARRS